MKIIALCGQKGTGKDLVATNIIDYITASGKPVRKLQFGDLTRQIISQAFGLRSEREYNQLIRGFVTLPNGSERTGKEIAKTIQMKLRQANSKPFTDAVEDAILEFKGYHPDQFNDVTFVITDLRLKDELKWCKAHNAVIIKVKRQNGYFDPLVDQIEIDDLFCNDVINNDGTEQELKATIDSRIDKWLQNDATI